MSACRCGGVMQPARRYENERPEPVTVWCCFDCGVEIPPLYRRNTLERNGVIPDVPTICRGCGRAFLSVRSDHAVFCGLLCANRVVSVGTQFGQRRVS